MSIKIMDCNCGDLQQAVLVDSDNVVESRVTDNNIDEIIKQMKEIGDGYHEMIYKIENGNYVDGNFSVEECINLENIANK